MYRKVMVAVDDSETSRAAFEEAKNIAYAHAAQLCILHVADETLMGMQHRTFSTTLNLDNARQAIREAGQKLLDELAAQSDGNRTEVKLLEASSKRVSEVIDEAASAWQADLIVIGTHGRRGLQRFILGSVAEQLVRIASVSVLLVRKH